MARIELQVRYNIDQYEQFHASLKMTPTQFSEFEQLRGMNASEVNLLIRFPS